MITEFNCDSIREKLSNLPLSARYLVDNSLWSLHTATDYIDSKNNNNNNFNLELLSPLAPDESGISVFVQNILPFMELSYKVQIVHPNAENLTVHKDSNTKIIHPNDLNSSTKNTVRVLHIGNSQYHTWMYDMDHENSICVAILHDIFLGHERRSTLNNNIIDLVNLFSSEGGSLKDIQAPCSLPELSNTLVNNHPFMVNILSKIKPKAIIVHSNYAANLVSKFTQNKYLVNKNLYVLPLYRQIRRIYMPTSNSDERSLAAGKYIVCAGNITPNKMTKEIVEGFLASNFCKSGGRLVFAGKHYNDDYYKSIQNLINEHDKINKITFTGYINSLEYNNILRHSLLAIQLRKNSRGESSATIAECSSYLIPTIINEHGSFAEEDESAFFMIPEAPTIDDIAWAIDS